MPTEVAALEVGGIRLSCSATDREDAIDQVGQALLEIGAVEEAYLAALHDRERSLSTYIGEGVAIPHGTDASRRYVRRTAIVIVQFPEGVDWAGEDVRMCVGIAANGHEQVGILSALARSLLDPARAAELRAAPDAATVTRILQSTDEETAR